MKEWSLFPYKLFAGINTGAHCGHSHDGYERVLTSVETDSAESPLSAAEAVIRSRKEAFLNL